jgi:formylglycine-generating enzyme required for sulfatase activity
MRGLALVPVVVLAAGCTLRFDAGLLHPDCDAGQCDAGAPHDAGGDGGAGDAGGGDGGTPCHADEVWLPTQGVCIDRYEASGEGGTVAHSVAGVLPWDQVTWTEAQAACAAAGKTLCTAAQWRAACTGPNGTTYPYGNTYDGEACNGAEQPFDARVETGSLPGCEGGYPGLFDMSGNNLEWVADCDQNDYCEAYGGSFYDVAALTCASASTYRQTEYFEGLGFRCCRVP